MTNEDKFKLSVTGDNLRALNPTTRTPGDIWQMLVEIEKAELKAEVAAAMKPRA